MKGNFCTSGVLPLSFFVPDTVTFLVSEKNTGREHVTYSDAVYTVVIGVTLGEGNKLVPEITVNGTKTDKIELAFENIYDYTPETTPNTTPDTTPDTTTPETTPVVPDTGDGAQLSMWVTMLCVSATAVVAVELLRRKTRRER